MRRRAALGSFWLAAAAAALVALATPLDAALRPPALKSAYKSARIATTTTSSTTTATESVTPTAAAAAQENPKENDADKAASSPSLSESSETSNNGTKPAPQLTGIPQKDYIYDPNLPRELNGADLTDYPFYSSLPENITFPCDGLKDGFYASVVHKCQVYHHCLFGTRYDFLCANYTAFDQRTFICHFVSEVDCENSPKYFDRNEALYKATTTTTIAPLTPPPRPQPVPQREGPRRVPGRRRRPMRKRRPIYEYYYDDDYESDDYYEDEPAPPPPPAPHKGRRRKRPRPPPEPVEDPIEDDDSPGSAAPPPPPPEPTGPVVNPKVRVQGNLPLTPSVYERPRAPPRIRRPVPLNERDKYEYTPTSGKAAEPSAQRAPAEKAAADDEFYDDDDPAAEEASPASSSTPVIERNRPSKKQGKRRPAEPTPVEDPEEEDDYEEPPRRFNRPSQGGRRRKQHRNRPGSQPSAPAATSTTTRRPKSTTPKPADDEEYYDDEEDVPESPPARRPSSTTTTTTTTTTPPPPPRRSSHKSRTHKRKPTTAAPPIEDDEEYYDEEPIVSSTSTKAPTSYSFPSFRPRSRPSTTPATTTTTTSTTTTTTTTTEEPPPEEPEPLLYSQAPRNGRRPFLPSRGGSASLPRGLQPLGSKAKTAPPAPVASPTTYPPPEIENPRVHKRPPPTPYPSVASIRDVIEPVTYRATAPALDGLGYRSRLPVTITKYRGSSVPVERVVGDDTSKYSIRPYKTIGETTMAPTPAPTTLTTTAPPPPSPPPQIPALSKDDFDDYDEYENDALHPPLTAPKAIPSVYLPYRQLRSQASTATAVVKAPRDEVRPDEDSPATSKRGTVHYQALSSASHQTPVRTNEPQRQQTSTTLVALQSDDFRPAVLYSPKESPYQAYIADLRQQQQQHQQLVQQYQQQQMRRYQLRQPSSADFYSTY